jgi:hypothetical protein
LTNTLSTNPILLRSFTALQQGNDALILWTYQTEINGYRFDIERSIDGVNFVKIGTVQAV